jgi:hypothetical protein
MAYIGESPPHDVKKHGLNARDRLIGQLAPMIQSVLECDRATAVMYLCERSPEERSTFAALFYYKNIYKMRRAKEAKARHAQLRGKHV